MTSLVIAEHDNATVKGATLNTVTAALKCGGDVHVLIAGSKPVVRTVMTLIASRLWTVAIALPA